MEIEFKETFSFLSPTSLCPAAAGTALQSNITKSHRKLVFKNKNSKESHRAKGAKKGALLWCKNYDHFSEKVRLH